MDTMKIELALSAEEWQKAKSFPLAAAQVYFDSNGDSDQPDVADVPTIIALLNAALPGSDSRKIKHHWVSWLREEADILKRQGAGAGALIAHDIADALESYLPPDTGP